MKSPYLALLAPLALSAGCSLLSADRDECGTDQDCVQAFGAGSSCLEDGFCSEMQERSLYNGVSNEEVISAATVALSGPLSDLGISIRDGVRAAYAGYNQDVPAGMPRFRHIVRDDEYDPRLTKQFYEELLAPDAPGAGRDFFGFVGVMGSPTSAFILDDVNDRGIPLFGTVSGGDHLRKRTPDEVVWNVRASYELEAREITDYLINRIADPIPAQNILLISQGPADEDPDTFGQADLAEQALLDSQTVLDAYGASGYRGASNILIDEGVEANEIPIASYESRNSNINVSLEYFFTWLAGKAARGIAPNLEGEGNEQVGIVLTTVLGTAEPLVINIISGMQSIKAGKPPMASLAPRWIEWQKQEPAAFKRLQEVELTFAFLSAAGDNFATNLSNFAKSQEGIPATAFCSPAYPILLSSTVPSPTAGSAGAKSFRRDLDLIEDGTSKPKFSTFEGWIVGRVWVAAINETIRRVGIAGLTEEEFFNTLRQNDFEVDVGIGDPIKFDAQQAGSRSIYGIQVVPQGDECVLEDFDISSRTQ